MNAETGILSNSLGLALAWNFELSVKHANPHAVIL
jgi:hypothetical protein